VELSHPQQDKELFVMGAFDFGHYKYGHDGRNNPRLGAAIIAIKNELRYVGFAREAMVGDLPYFGNAVENSVKDFQTAKRLSVTGRVDPTTARELFRRRVIVTEDKYNLPDGSLGKKFWLESLYDPVAVGTSDPDDSGIAQINIRIHNIPVTKAFDPAFAIDWAGLYLKENYERIAQEANVMKAARASYNTGVFHARRWMQAGFPPSGGEWDDNTGIDWFARATNYITLIDKQTW
jgi:hypothetical protein